MGRPKTSAWWSLPWLQMRLAFFQRENRQLSRKNRELQSENGVLLSLSRSRGHRINELEEEVTRHSSDASSAASQLTEQIVENHKLLDWKDSLLEEKAALLRDVNILRESIKEEQNKNSDLRSAAFRLQTDIDMKNNAIAILEDQIQFLSKVNALNHAAVKAAIATTAGTQYAKPIGDAEPGSQDGGQYSQ